MNNKRYWLWFILAFGVASTRIWEIVRCFKDIKSAYIAICNGNHSSLNGVERKKIISTHIEQCDSIIKYCDDKKYRIISFEDKIYPPRLRSIQNPPAVLFCMGNIENFIKRPSIACVGTRYPSAYSADITEKICAELAARECAIVSGFAIGLDSAAHRGALSRNGCTVAVMACGIDVDYPKENKKAKELIVKNGAILSEFLPGTHPDRRYFHFRNRIISGLCFGTLITEADISSGALITADHALNQGRTLFCIPPGDIFDKRYLGVVKYLREGAIAVYSHFDILYEYYVTGNYIEEIGEKFDWNEMYSEEGIPYRDSRTSKKKIAAPNKTELQEVEENNKTKEASTDNSMIWKQLYEQMNDDQKAIINCLKDGAKHSDEISIQTEKDSFAVMAVMTELEMLGAAELLPDHKYKLC